MSGHRAAAASGDNAVTVLQEIQRKDRLVRAALSVTSKPLQDWLASCPGPTTLYSKPGLYDLIGNAPHGGDRAALFELKPAALAQALQLEGVPCSLPDGPQARGHVVSAQPAPQQAEELASRSEEHACSADPSEARTALTATLDSAKQKKHKRDKKDKGEHREKKSKAHKRGKDKKHRHDGGSSPADSSAAKRQRTA